MAGSFTVLAGTDLESINETEILGDAGVYPGNQVSGLSRDMVAGSLEIATPAAGKAQLDLLAAFIGLESQVPTRNLSGQPLGGMILTPGVYKFDQDALLEGELLLNNGGNPEGVFIFQVTGDLVLAAAAAISFSESAKPRIRNIFWQVQGSVTLSEGSAFRGTILTNNDITAQASTLVQGRLLSIGGQVSLNGTQIGFPTDLSLSISKSPGASQNGIYYINDYITFTLKAENLGPVNAANVRVRSMLPPGISYVSSRASTADYDAATSIWTIGNMASGSSQTLSVTGKINERALEILTHSASIAGAGMEEVVSNNSDIITGICVAPANPGTIKGAEIVCSKSSDNVFSVDPIPGVMNYNWLPPAGWTIISGQNSPAITVRAGSSSGILTLIVGNVCASNTSQKNITVSAAKPQAPAAILAASATPCAGQSGIVYSVTPVNGALSYVWQVPQDWTITAGQGTTAITVTAGQQSGTVRVAAANGCGESTALALPVTATANKLPVPEKVISQGAFCANTTLELQVAEIPGATAYSWTVPADWQIKAGAGTHKIAVTVGTATGEVRVAASNSCVTGEAASLAVSPVTTLAAGAVSGLPAPCAGESTSYSIASLPGATGYTWTLPAGWKISSGEGTHTITVVPGNTAGLVSVAAVNGCGPGPAARLAVSPVPLPLAPGAIAASNPSPCAGEKDVIYAITPVAGATSYSWTVPQDWLITSGQGSTTITVTTGAAAGQVALRATNSCGASTVAARAVVPGLAPMPST